MESQLLNMCISYRSKRGFYIPTLWDLELILSFVLVVYDKKQRAKKVNLSIFSFFIFCFFEKGLFLGCLVTTLLFVLQ
jgi:hypothetical protein